MMILEFWAKNHNTNRNLITHWHVGDNVSLPDLVKRYNVTHDLHGISVDGDEMFALWARVTSFCDANIASIIWTMSRDSSPPFVQSWDGNIAKFIAEKLFAVPIPKLEV